MANKRKSSSKHPIIRNSLVRILGQHAPAQQVLQRAAQTCTLPIQIRSTPTPTADDYALVDPALTLDPQTASVASEKSIPPMGVGYAAFTPSQRYQLLQWLNHPETAAPPAFQQFYLAQLEVGLLEPEQREQVEAEVRRLQQAPAWRQHVGLARLCLLVHWLTQDGVGLATWLSEEEMPGPLLGVALGLQALLQQPLQPRQIPALLHQWAIEAALPSNALLTLRLSSLATTLGHEPLAYALAGLTEGACRPRPWRSQHRDLRLALPQPDVRPTLEPLLRDLTILSDEVADTSDTNQYYEEGGEEGQGAGSRSGWELVLEFGESRSEFFAMALAAAQKQPGYLALMDEDRHMIHRVHFRKGEVRRFWPLWEYVQSWSSAKVYLNGDEISKWDLYARLWQVR